MLLLFLSLAKSQYIPYSLTDECTIPRINASLLPSKARGLKTVIGIGLKPDDPETKSREQTIIEASYYYGEMADFYFLEPVSADAMATEYGIRMPCIFVYRVGLLCGTYNYPQADTGVMFLLKLLLEPMPEPVQNLSEVYSQLGNSPYSFIVTPERYNNAISLQFDCSSNMQIGVVVAVPQILLSFGLNYTKIALFRSEDRTITQAREYKEGLYQQTYPVFRILMSSDLRGPDTIVFALVAPTLTDEYRDFLYNIGLANPGFVVGYLPRNLRSYAESICHVIFEESTVAVVAFNYDNGFYYDTSSEFTADFYKRPFSLQNWYRKGNNILAKILKGQIKPEFISEPEPAVSETNVQMLVGTTYEQFVMDPNYDVVVLYKREGCDNCVEFFPEYLEFAKSLSNYTYLKFGYIDIMKNSAKKKYPFMPGVPHVHFFPAKNKSNDQPMRGGRSTDSMLRMIKTNSEFEYAFEAPPLDKASASLELFTLLFAAKDMPPEEQAKAMEYVKSISDMLNTTSTDQQNTTKKVEPDLTKEL